VGPRLGYSLSEPIDIASFVGQPSLTNAVAKALTVILVLHPVCAGIAFILFLLCWIRRHAAGIVALIVAIVLAIVGSVTLAIDLALVLVARSRVPDLTDGELPPSLHSLGCLLMSAPNRQFHRYVRDGRVDDCRCSGVRLDICDCHQYPRMLVLRPTQEVLINFPHQPALRNVP
jgi:hypothetical protein